MSEDLILAAKRWKDIELLQEHYAKFTDFLRDVNEEVLGFNCTDIQLDIAEFLESGPKYKMVQAQRGQAKTTITACYAVWRLIQNPRTRILVISAGDTMATQISFWIIQIIQNMPELKCLRPDTTAGDRSSVKGFDVHHTLKGYDKSPSVACLGITSNMQGFRADVLIADDIESAKNSQTAVQRERINHLTRDFVSICASGDIIYLGTPQNNDSMYNSLPSRGFTVRVWPGRYPTNEELPNYKEFLAPLIAQRIANDPSLQTGGGPSGSRGKPIDPVLLGEDALTAKEIDQGRAYFQLQHMLDTKLMDEDRYPLKCKDLVFMSTAGERTSLSFNWSRTNDRRIYPPQGFPLQESFYEATPAGEEYGFYTGKMMYVDPAGGGKNGDEIAYAVTYFLAGRVYLRDAGGIPGGYTEDRLRALNEVVLKHKPNTIQIEKNYGNGAFKQIWWPYLNKELETIGHKCGIEEVWETGQKELRIIDTMEPIISSQRLIVDPEILKKDWELVQKYPAEKRATYSLFFQLSRLTRDKRSLIHDDRLDAVSGACRYWVEALALDAAKVAAKIKNDNYARLMKDPLGSGRPLPGTKSNTLNAFAKFRRKS
jgi:hypothetical protein